MMSPDRFVAQFALRANCLIGDLKRLLEAAFGRIEICLVVAVDEHVAATRLPLMRDTQGEFARAYATTGLSAFVVRPDGYLGMAMRGTLVTQDLQAHLKATFD